MSEWQPIETAPKDGKPILLFLSPPLDANESICFLPCDLQIVVGFAEDNYRDGVDWKCGIGYEGYGDSYGICPTISIKLTPTNWMPLPAPPEMKP